MPQNNGATGCVAVLDIGKTNVKLNVVTPAGDFLETVSRPNTVLAAPPWRHHDLGGLSEWVFTSLADLCRRHLITAFVTSGHGSGGVLVCGDPDDGDGAALPMIDYEQALPDTIRDGYGPLSGSFSDRGSALMLGATHQARQLYWMQEAEPAAFAAARWYLGVPQYWAWRLSGVAVSEFTILGAQSHLWNVAEARFTPIVAARGWQRLMPPFARAYAPIGTIRAALAARYGIPQQIAVFPGIHDSSANFYRYQAAGLADATVVSTGTWIVALSTTTPLERLDERRSMTCNSDVDGRPVGGSLTMGGREFTAIAGSPAHEDAVTVETVGRLVARGTFAIPTFGADDGIFAGTAGRGRIDGPPPADAGERKALAVLYSALTTLECLDALDAGGTVVLDGSFLREPVYASLVATLRPGADTRFSLESYGVASGAALLFEHRTRTAPASLPLGVAAPLGALRDTLAAYAAQWRERSRANTDSGSRKG
ncbi:FGGY-family carbohydrate kinase [Ensifer soli]|uniref:FGGY-family carbohydrate kinase n=1 Tax=Ciceribacter sp. sgz301302 TaxID=3342379 RepID=UPI0035B8C1ED